MPRADRVYSLRGVAYKDKGEYDKAIADFTNAIRLYEHDTHLFKNRCKAYKLKGDIEKANEDFAKAIADLTVVIRVNPYHAEAYFDRGDAYKKKGDVEKAKDDFATAKDLDTAVRGSSFPLSLVRSISQCCRRNRPFLSRLSPYKEAEPCPISSILTTNGWRFRSASVQTR